MTPDLTIVIPVHNEQDNIEILLAEIEKEISASIPNYEIIVVNDGSNDSTLSVLKSSLQARTNLKIFHHRTNLGQSSSLLSGVKGARSRWVATLDGDGQNDPHDITKLWNLINAPDSDIMMVVGRRKIRSDSVLRKASSRIANNIRRFLLRDKVADSGCALKIFDREIFMSLPHFDHFHRFLPALYQRAGGKVISVDVSHRARRSGKSHYGVNNRLWVGISDLLGVIWLIKRGKPWLLNTPTEIHSDPNNKESPDGH